MATVRDENLIRRSRGGDPQAFAQLIRRHEQPLAALIRRQIADAHHREDVLQETLLQAWQGLGKLRDAAKVKAWLVMIARNRCRDFNRSPRRLERPADEEALRACVTARGRDVSRPADADNVCEAIMKIPAKQRDILNLFYYQGLSIAEIGVRMARPVGTVKSRLFHARRALGRQLEGR